MHTDFDQTRRQRIIYSPAVATFLPSEQALLTNQILLYIEADKAVKTEFGGGVFYRFFAWNQALEFLQSQRIHAAPDGADNRLLEI